MLVDTADGDRLGCGAVRVGRQTGVGDARSKEDVGRCSRGYGFSGRGRIGPAWPSAYATATSPSPAASSGWTPPLVLVARSLAMEWPPLGLDLRELEMALN